MKEKLKNKSFVGIVVLTNILLFSILDHSLHILNDAWSVPDFYFEDKIPFGFLWGIVGLLFARKLQNIWTKSLVFSAVIAITLQFRYLITGYALSFVILFLFFHFFILYIVSLGMFTIFDKYLPSATHPETDVHKKQIIIALLVLLFVSVGTYYAVFDKSMDHGEVYTSYQYTPKNLNTPTVTIKDFAFGPKTLRVKTGTKVTWINDDNAPHTVTGVTGSILDSPSLSTGQSYSVTFTETGTFDYYCSFHPMMKGEIVVTN